MLRSLSELGLKEAGMASRKLSRIPIRISQDFTARKCTRNVFDPRYTGTVMHHNRVIRQRSPIFRAQQAVSSRFYTLARQALSRGIHTANSKQGRIYTNGYRSYYVDRYGVKHFKERGPGAWRGGGQLSQKMIIICVVLGGMASVVYYTHLEVVPYTNRKHFVLVSPEVETMLGETTFNNMKKQFKNRILPPYHPAVVRVSQIAQKSIKSAMEGVHATSDGQLEYTTEVSPNAPVTKSHSHDYLMGSDEEIEQPKRFTKQLYRESETTLDDVWVEDSRKEGIQKGRRPDTKHVDRFKWEIVVVDAPVVNAACLPGGKIIVFTGLLKVFPHDEEIATVLGHEVGHAIARHTGETLTRSIFIGFFELLFVALVQLPGVVGPASDLLLRLPFSRKMEIEADHIGVLVMAASGYDPRVAPGVYMKLGELQKAPEFVQYISTHPSGKTRAEGLLKSQTLKEAIRMYEAQRGGWDSMGFLM